MRSLGSGISRHSRARRALGGLLAVTLLPACDPDLLIIRTGAFAMRGDWTGSAGGGIQIIVGFGEAHCVPRHGWQRCGIGRWEAPSGEAGPLRLDARDEPGAGGTGRGGDARVRLRVSDPYRAEGPAQELVARLVGGERLEGTLPAASGLLPAGPLLLVRRAP